MSSLLVPWFATCSILAVAGVAKLRKPAPTSGALRAMGLPSHTPVVLALGLVEVALAVAGLAGARWAAALVAAAYVGFAAFVLLALRRGGDLQSCGCFGSPDVPATGLHLLVDLVAAGVATAAALGSLPSLGATLGEGASGVVVVGVAAVATVEGLLLLTLLPRVQARSTELRAAFGW
jgi:hypothetical protein